MGLFFRLRFYGGEVLRCDRRSSPVYGREPNAGLGSSPERQAGRSSRRRGLAGLGWGKLVGATSENTDGTELEAIAHSYREPGKIQVHRDPGEPDDLHRGRVLEEGYDFALRAYTFRKKGDDRVSITLTPSAPQINPVFLINGWSSPDVRLTVDGVQLDSSQYQAR
jgi:hypothetical protein